MRYCILGASGQIGERLCQRLSGKYFSHAQCDVTNIDHVRNAVKDVDWVINAAGVVGVDSCEENKTWARHVNERGVKVVAQVCAERDVPLCHFSTGDIFSGYYRREHSTTDEPRPVNFYGLTKLRGERFVRRLPRSLVVRSSWVYGGAGSFVQRVLQASKSDFIEVPGDQYSRPTFAKDLVESVESMIEASVVGVVHYANMGWCSYAELAEEVLRMVGSRTVVQHTSTDIDSPGKARSPKFSVLQVSDFPFLRNRHWKYALADYLGELGFRAE